MLAPPPIGPWRIDVAHEGFVARRSIGPRLAPLVMHMVLDGLIGLLVLWAVALWASGGLSSLWWLLPLIGVGAWGIFVARDGTRSRWSDVVGPLEVRCGADVLETRAPFREAVRVPLYGLRVLQGAHGVQVKALDGTTYRIPGSGPQLRWMVQAISARAQQAVDPGSDHEVPEGLHHLRRGAEPTVSE